jgi:hypothetical protein
MKITIAQEQAARSQFVADVQAFGALAGNVFNRRRSVSSRQDFFAKLGQTVGVKTFIRYVDIELIQIEDDPTEGPDDCPVAVLTYNLHAFHEFQDEIAGGGNSDYDFTDFLLQMRAFFLDRQAFGISGWRVETTPLTFPEFTQFGNDNFTDVVGHFKDLTLKAYFYDA